MTRHNLWAILWNGNEISCLLTGHAVATSFHSTKSCRFLKKRLQNWTIIIFSFLSFHQRHSLHLNVSSHLCSISCNTLDWSKNGRWGWWKALIHSFTASKFSSSSKDIPLYFLFLLLVSLFIYCFLAFSTCKLLGLGVNTWLESDKIRGWFRCYVISG